ncbi:hypothetical protein GWI33_005580 [Rhynchophorus ferrugineus]|uniref:Uncharacterized protein n=1 Tax=Rhynchophorus ferrugineus TaxID=354439 RepID=A0A834MJH7_RHYFE|nr:hypothetical protein GWI33_005580 [Rhynchophorus ferrugineus]
MINKSTEVLTPEKSVFEMEVQEPYSTDNKKKLRNRVHLVSWDRKKSYILAVFVGCFVVWCLVFFPMLIFKGDM